MKQKISSRSSRLLVFFVFPLLQLGFPLQSRASTDPDIWVTPGCQEDPGAGRTDPDIWVVSPCQSPTSTTLGGDSRSRKPVVRYKYLKTLWDHGTTIPDKLLEGRWKNIAVATTKACSVVAENTYDDQGLQNPDGAVFELNFLQGGSGLMVRPVTGKKSDAESSPVARNQARFKRPFSTQLSGNNGGSLEFVCRIVSRNQNKMICAFTVLLENPEGANSSIKTCANSENGTMQVYARVK